jgi:hypothetical protein
MSSECFRQIAACPGDTVAITKDCHLAACSVYVVRSNGPGGPLSDSLTVGQFDVAVRVDVVYMTDAGGTCKVTFEPSNGEPEAAACFTQVAGESDHTIAKQIVCNEVGAT